VCIVHTGIAYAAYFSSVKTLKAQSVAVLSYIDPVCALLLSAIFLRERLTLLGLLGAALILASALVSELGEKRAG
jgi:drug/metabolite transporter (DMT)-like permease